MNPRYSVVIAGGGPVGLALARLLERRGCCTCLIARADTTGAFRPIALSHASFTLCQSLVPMGADSPIRTVEVSQHGQPGRTTMQASEHGLEALGYVIDLTTLSAALAHDMQPPAHIGSVTAWHPQASDIRVDWADPSGQVSSVDAQLLVLADGGHGMRAAREYDYHQQALVCSVKPERGHDGIAHEIFTADGPLALLPCGDRYAVVWTLPSAQAARMLGADEPTFLAALQNLAGDRHGRLSEPGPRQAQPLLRRQTRSQEARVLLIGNAAQTVHPVAGQGLNLGLRDALVLALQAAGQAHTDLGGAEFINRYERTRSFDRHVTVGLTDLLARVTRIGAGPGMTLPGLTRGLALTALQACPPARRFLARRLMLGARALP